MKSNRRVIFCGIVLIICIFAIGLAGCKNRGTRLKNGTGYSRQAKMKLTTVDDNKKRSWVLAWSDEFAVEEFTDGKLTGHNVDGPGTELEGPAFTYMMGNGNGYSGAGWGNGEKEIYVDTATKVASGRDIDGGALVITAEKKARNLFTSARLWSMDDGDRAYEPKVIFAKRYGRIEARIRVVPKDGEDPTGLWPAFWLLPAGDEYGGWAASGEIDIMEARGSNLHSVEGAIQFGAKWPSNSYKGGASSAIQDIDITEWHTYAVEWLPGEIKWFVDDICYYSANDWFSCSNLGEENNPFPAPFDKEFYVLLNLAVGGNFDKGALSENLTGGEMYVDYVRAYDLVNDGVVCSDDAYDAMLDRN